MFALMLLSGCMPSVRLNDRAVVQAVAVDRTEDGYYRATIQLAEVIGGSAGPNQPESAKEELVIEETGRTMTELFTQASVHQGKQLFLGSLRFLLVGEEAARSGMEEMLGFFNANHQVQPTLAVAVATGEAGDIIYAGQEESIFTADGMMGLLSSAQKAGYAPRSQLMNIIGAFSAENGTGSLAVLAMEPTPGEDDAPSGEESGKESEEVPQEKAQKMGLSAVGTAIFRGDRMVSAMDVDSTRGLSWLGDELESTPLTVEAEALGTVSSATHSNRSKISVEPLGDHLVFTIEVWIRSTAYEANLTDGQPLGEEQRAYTERLQEKQVREEIERALNSTEKAGYDVLGLSRLVRQQHPDFYLENRQNWDEILKSSGYEVTVHCTIDRTGVGNWKS